MTTLIERFTTLLDGLRRAVGNQWRAMPGDTPLPSRINHFVNWTLHRLPRALDRARTGDVPPKPRPRPVEPRQPAPPKSDRAIATRAFRLPTREAWLIARMPVPHHVTVHGGALQHLLADPEMAPLLASPSVNRLLRPLCRMLGMSASLPPPAAPGTYVPPPPFVPKPPAAEPPPPTDAWSDCALPFPAISFLWPMPKIPPSG